MMRKLLAAFAIICALAAMPAAADTHGSLFVNLTTDESHRADMAMAFSKAMMERDHPVVVWLNDKGVFIASKEHAGKFAEQQKMLSDCLFDVHEALRRQGSGAHRRREGRQSGSDR